MKLERQLHILIGLVAAMLTTWVVYRLMHSVGALQAASTESTVDSLWLFVRESADVLAALGVLVISLAGDVRNKVLDLVLGPVEDEQVDDAPAQEPEPIIAEVPEPAPKPTVRRRRK